MMNRRTAVNRTYRSFADVVVAVTLCNGPENPIFLKICLFFYFCASSCIVTFACFVKQNYCFIKAYFVLLVWFYETNPPLLLLFFLIKTKTILFANLWICVETLNHVLNVG
jgi:hypothetical protein